MTRAFIPGEDEETLELTPDRAMDRLGPAEVFARVTLDPARDCLFGGSAAADKEGAKH